MVLFTQPQIKSRKRIVILLMHVPASITRNTRIDRPKDSEEISASESTLEVPSSVLLILRKLSLDVTRPQLTILTQINAVFFHHVAFIVKNFIRPNRGVAPSRLFNFRDKPLCYKNE